MATPNKSDQSHSAVEFRDKPPVDARSLIKTVAVSLNEERANNYNSAYIAQIWRRGEP
jgi:hypothetical protein